MAKLKQYLLYPYDVDRPAPSERPIEPTARPTLGGVLFGLGVILILGSIPLFAFAANWSGMLLGVVGIVLTRLMWPRSMLRLLARWRKLYRALTT